MLSALVPLDGSDNSKTATAVAIEFSKVNESRLVGIGIIDEPTITAPEPIPLGASSFKEVKDDVLLEHATKTVQGFVSDFNHICTEAGVPHDSVVTKGLPYDEICRESHRHDMIIMARESHFHFETQIAADEVFEKVVKHTPRPVLAVAQELPEGDRILVAYDGSLQAARTLQIHHMLGLCTGRTVEVVTVAEDAEQAAYVNRHAVDYYHKRGINVLASPVASGERADTVLLEKIDSAKPRHLVMGSYGKSTVKEYFFGSVSRTLIARCPVGLFLYD